MSINDVTTSTLRPPIKIHKEVLDHVSPLHRLAIQAALQDGRFILVEDEDDAPRTPTKNGRTMTKAGVE